jgi:Zn-dependent peptidase ImmA (M78 family)
MIDKIKYLGREITVEYFKEHLRNLNMGSCNTLKDVISINEDISLNKRQETMLHELIHSISDDFNLDLNENAVCTLANILYATIKENKDIIDKI